MHTTELSRIARTLAFAGTLTLWTLGSMAAALAQSPPAQSPCTEAADTAPATVNVNTASAAELERLPRIGPARAQAILRLREHLGGFRRPSQLLRVKGIGRATLRGLLPHIRFADPPRVAGEGVSQPDPVP